MNLKALSKISHTPAGPCVLIVGANGQLGWELQRTAPENLFVVALGSSDLDITNEKQVNHVLTKFSPVLVINAAAYTAVDKAEQQPKLAYAVNAEGVGFLADACQKTDSKLIHISTDFVFDGSHHQPYIENDVPNPLGVYGASKLKGEELVMRKTLGKSLIIRTSWVYSIHGHNFVKTMLKLMSSKESLSIVCDQFGSPTWAKGLALAIWDLTKIQNFSGIYHWSDSGVISWYDFAKAIQEKSLKIGLLERKINLQPIQAIEYPNSKIRPSYSALDCTSLRNVLSGRFHQWRHNLNLMLEELSTECDLVG